MMVLTDASRHDWLEGRGPHLTLIGFQDDATGQILSAHFQLEPENTVGYLRALDVMIATHGIPLSLYRDRHSIFQRNDSHWTLAEQLAGKQAPTQLGRALDELGIEQIPAYSPQAKGRIERAWRTFQDRLVSELRLANVKTLEQANAVLARFCAQFNQRFAALPPRPRATLAPCRALLIWLGALASAINALLAPITSSRSAPKPSPCPRCLPGVAMPDKPSNSRISWMASCASIADSVCCSRYLCLCRKTKTAAPPPAPLPRSEILPPAHLQSLRPPRSRGRYLIDEG
jgi:hypothetical protein